MATLFRRVGSRLYQWLMAFPTMLSWVGIVDREKGREAFDLAVPVMVTGLVRTILSVTDFFFVSLALGTAAVAALEFGIQYFFVGFGLALALASGTISVVSRCQGAGDSFKADLAVKQSLWIALGISAVLTAVCWWYAEPLIAILTDDARAIDLGGTYLRIVMLAVAFRFWSMIAWLSLAGVGNTRTPMYVELVTVPTNIALTGLLVFGVGPAPRLGIAGAAWGTAIASVLSATIFFYLLTSGRYAVQLRLGGPQVDLDLMREIVRVALPLAGVRLTDTLGRFPFLWILATLGTPVVAAYAIGNRVMMLARMPAWGYSTASSTLVGQHLGADEADQADAYGWQTVRLALATQILIAVALIVAARPIAVGFGAEHVDLTTAFIQVFGLAVGGFSVAQTLEGGLRGAGDTTWPFFGVVAGMGVRIGVAVLALPAGLVVVHVGDASVAPGIGIGIAAVYLAILFDMYIRATINAVRFRTGAWKGIARRSLRETTEGD